MPRKIDVITEMYRVTLNNLTKSEKNWKAFLNTAAFQYKYPFKDQVLIFAQRPSATACVELEVWNGRFNRYVNKGSHGIALIRESGGRLSLNHVFDVKDTHPSNRGYDDFRLWELTGDADNEVKASLENRFGTLKSKLRIVDSVISAVNNICEDNITDYLGSLSQSSEGSFLEGYDEDNLDVKLRPLLEGSVAYSVLTRLGFRADEYIDNDVFDGLYEFNSPATINCLGSATGDIAEICLREIERTVRAYEKSKKEIRTFDASEAREYNRGENNKNRNGGNENEIKRNDDLGLQGTGRGDDTRLEAPAAEGSSSREIRDDETGLSENAPQGDLHDSRERSETDGTPVRDRTDSEKADFGEYIPTGDEPWGNGENESGESDVVGTGDEQHQSVSGGGSSEQLDLRLNEKQEDILYPDELIQILRHGDYLTHSKAEIVSFLSHNKSEVEKTDYIRECYPKMTVQMFKTGTTDYIGYSGLFDDGLHLFAGNFMNPRATITFDWETTRKLIEALISDKNYLDEPKEGQQITLEDVVNTPIPEEKPAPTVNKRLAVSQEVIDSFLRLGGCTKNSNYRIYGYYRRANNPEENTTFLKAQYETDAVGLIVGGQKASVVWDESGVTFAQGESVYNAWNTLKMSWAEVDNRIRELIELGQYISQSEIETAITVYDDSVGARIAYIMRDFFRERDIPFKAEGNLTWDDEFKHYAEVLKDPVKVEQFAEAFTKAADEMTVNSHRRESYTPPFTAMLIRSYLRDPRDFPAEENVLPPEHYLTQDQIDNRLIGNGSSVSDGKLRIYSFFLRNKDTQERAKFLSGEYGIGGSYGNRGGDEHDSKGLAFIGGLDRISDKSVLLNWTQVAKRIDDLIRKDRYMSENETAHLDSYEKEQVARAITGFYMNKPDEVEKPFDNNGDPFSSERVNEVIPQLEDEVRLAQIVSMMQAAFDSEMPGGSHCKTLGRALSGRLHTECQST